MNISHAQKKKLPVFDRRMHEFHQAQARFRDSFEHPYEHASLVYDDSHALRNNHPDERYWVAVFYRRNPVFPDDPRGEALSELSDPVYRYGYVLVVDTDTSAYVVLSERSSDVDDELAVPHFVRCFPGHRSLLVQFDHAVWYYELCSPLELVDGHHIDDERSYVNHAYLDGTGSFLAWSGSSHGLGMAFLDDGPSPISLIGAYGIRRVDSIHCFRDDNGPAIVALQGLQEDPRHDGEPFSSGLSFFVVQGGEYRALFGHHLTLHYSPSEFPLDVEFVERKRRKGFVTVRIRNDEGAFLGDHQVPSSSLTSRNP